MPPLTLPNSVRTDLPWLAEQLKLVHVTLDYTLLTLIVIHAAAALKHHVADRDDVLRRMLPCVKPAGE